MAEKPAARPASTGGASKLPRDAFVSRLVSDPANLDPTPPVVLRGFVGDSDEPGYSRIYCGPKLQDYADVRDEDILHYEAATDGGEHTMWARADAQVKYGSRGAPKGEASSFVDGPLVNDYGGGTGGAGTGGPIGVTGWLGCGQATHLIGCTGYLGCGQPAGTIHPTIWTQIGCSTQAGCIPTVGLGCPNTISCPPVGGHPQALAAAAPLGPTAYLGCTHLLGCPNTSTCTPQTHLLGCPNTSTCTPQTHMLGCPNTSTCTPHVTVAQQSTAATLCTRYGCPHPGTLATVCTQVHCPSPGTYQYACTLGFTCTYVGCP